VELQKMPALKKTDKQEKYYSHQNFTLYLGDCIETLNSMPGSSIDMIFADPPYFLSGGSFTCHAGKRVSVKKADWDLGNGAQENLKFHTQWLKACKRVLKFDGSIWVSGTYHSIYQCGVALEINGYRLLNDISWFKPNAAPNLSCRFFTASHETLLWARKEKKGKHTFNYKLMKQGSWKEDAFKKDGMQMRSVWSIPTPKQSEKKFGKHPTQKPLDLLKRIVLASTNSGDIILDPFTGSSTTGLAAVLNDRTFIGIDNEKKYLDLSIKRFESLPLNKDISKITKGSPLESQREFCFSQASDDYKVKLNNKIKKYRKGESKNGK
jgi:site-specific DNA-methyltransferase (adenine-specific)